MLLIRLMSEDIFRYGKEHISLHLLKRRYLEERTRSRSFIRRRIKESDGDIGEWMLAIFAMLFLS